MEATEDMAAEAAVVVEVAAAEIEIIVVVGMEAAVVVVEVEVEVVGDTILGLVSAHLAIQIIVFK